MSKVRVAVIGHCASGKSTVADLLTARGYDAYSVAQEHSIVHDLWRHLQPDIVLFLGVSLAELRRRKNNQDWPDWIYDVQTRRLEHARDNATLVVDTDLATPEEVVARVEDFIGMRGGPYRVDRQGRH